MREKRSREEDKHTRISSKVDVAGPCCQEPHKREEEVLRQTQAVFTLTAQSGKKNRSWSPEIRKLNAVIVVLLSNFTPHITFRFNVSILLSKRNKSVDNCVVFVTLTFCLFQWHRANFFLESSKEWRSKIILFVHPSLYPSLFIPKRLSFHHSLFSLSCCIFYGETKTENESVYYQMSSLSPLLNNQGEETTNAHEEHLLPLVN